MTQEKLEEAKRLYQTANADQKYVLESLFPELKESEDERIRKELISYHRSMAAAMNGNRPCVHEAWIAWLEKQGEQKFSDIDNKFIRMRETKPRDISELLDRLTSVEQEFLWEHIAKIRELDKDEQKPTDKVEPKFKVGDWVMLDRPVLITKVEDMPYNTHQYWTSDGTWFGDATKAKLWTIQDAKDGDVLSYYGNQWTFIFKAFGEEENEIAYYALLSENGLTFNNYNYTFLSCAFKPATKEQCDLLFAKMKEAGYEWDAEKKELSKLVIDEGKTEMDYCFTKMMNDEKVSPAWSEEDESNLDLAIYHIRKEPYRESDVEPIVDWLRTLKERVLPKQEWSEDDETALTNIIIMLKEGASFHFNKKDVTKAVDWLKSLKPQKQQEWTQADKNFMNAAIAFVQQNKSFNCWGGVNKEGVIAFLQSLRPQSRWNPSEEQIGTLEEAMYQVGILTPLGNKINDLCEQLKKLMEE